MNEKQNDKTWNAIFDNKIDCESFRKIGSAHKKINGLPYKYVQTHTHKMSMMIFGLLFIFRWLLDWIAPHF